MHNTAPCSPLNFESIKYPIMNVSNLNDTMSIALQQDYTALLNGLAVTYTCDEYYIKVDFDQLIAERVIFVSGVLSQLPHLIEAVIPYLVSQKISFNVVKNRTAASLVLNANFGEQHIGKLILVYLSEGMNQAELVEALVKLTANFKGPAVPGHQFMGGSVYAKYPYPQLPSTSQKHPSILKNYVITTTLKPDPKGDVYQALYLNKFLIPKKCIIKQGRYGMWSDDQGRDIHDRLKWQCELHNRLSGFFHVPKIIDEFEEEGNYYLVMEFIKGMPFNYVLEDIYRRKSWADLSDQHKLYLLELLMDVFETVQQLHAANYIHRDLTPGNFILKKSGVLFMIDLELLYDLKSNFPSPVFKLGTAGFMSPEQWTAQIPTVKEDVFALGGFMIMCFTGLVPAKFELEKRNLLSQKLIELSVDDHLIRLILHCVESDPDHRPSMEVLIKMLEETMINYAINC
jgi:serine/threonine protein kinase